MDLAAYWQMTWTGKTIQVITLLEDAYGTGTAASLIICPASWCITGNMNRQIRTYLRCFPLSGTGRRGSKASAVREQLQEKQDGYQVLVTSHDLLKRDIRFYEDIHFRYQVIDEAQYIKNAATQSAKSSQSH